MSDVYKVGVRLAMTSNAPQVLSLLSKELLGVNAKVKELAGGFNKLKVAIGGAFAIYGGEKMLGTLGRMVEAGSEIVHQQQLLKIAGASNQQIAEATATAYKTSAQIQTTTIAGNLKHLRELRYALGNLGAAQVALPLVAKSNAVLQSVLGDTAKDQIWDLIKSAEIKGFTNDPKLLAAIVNDVTKAEIASGGKVDSQQLFQTFRYGRTAMLGWDESFIAGILPRLIQSFGGGGAGGRGGPGNALMSAFGEVVQGQMTRQAAQQFGRLGIASIQNIPGSSKSLTSVVGEKLFQQDPYSWVQSVLMPALTKAGITSQDAIVGEIGKLFPNRTAGQIITEMGLFGSYRQGSESLFEKDRKKAQQALAATPSFDQLMQSDPTTVMAAFTAQWQSLTQALGSVLVPPAIKGMQLITHALTALAQFGEAHSTAMKVIAEGFGALGIGLVAFGGAAIVAAIATVAGVPAVIGAAITGLATALTALAAVNWSSIIGWIKSLGDMLAGLWAKFKSLPGWGSFDPTSYTGGARYIPASYSASSYVGSAGRAIVNGGAGAASAPMGNLPSLGPLGPAGKYRQVYHLGPADLSSAVVDTIAGEAYTNNQSSVDAVIDNMLNRVGTKGWGPSANLLQVARAHGQYAGYRVASPAEAAFIRARIKAIASGSVPDITGGSNEYRAGSYHGPWYWHHLHNPVIGGNRFGYNSSVANGPYAPYHDDDGTASAAIPSGAGQVHVHHHTIKLDGRVIAKNTAKHIVKMGNGPASGARLPDYMTTRPLSV